MLSWFKKKHKLQKAVIPLNIQYQKLQQIGIMLQSNFKLEQVTYDFDINEYEEKPFILLLISLGSEIVVDGDFIYASNDIWYFDRECIEDSGDYVVVVNRIAQLIKGALVITNIQDQIDIVNNEALISFDLNGENKTLELDVNNDWLDIGIFKIFSDLLELNEIDLRFYYSDLGQGFLVGAFRKEQGIDLNKLLNIFMPFV